jgi:filamentous hemagglutinin family protein
MIQGAMRASGTPRVWHWLPSLRTVVALVCALGAADGAHAGDALRRTGTPSALGNAGAAAAAAQAQAAAARQQIAVRGALDSVRRAQEAQELARATGFTVQTDLPNGLQVGGLQVTPGAAGGATCATSGSTWCGAELPVQAQADGRTSVTIVQDAPKAILTWETFNVGRETDVRFDQSKGGSATASWVALNRIRDPLASPSTILGSLRADGQVYLVNRNGIIFGGTSQVNVATLVASGVEFASDAAYFNGIAAGTIGAPALLFSGGGAGVWTEPGARLSVKEYGQLVLFGGTDPGALDGGVHNGGTLFAPDGQVLLASGTELRLGATGDRPGSTRWLSPPTLVAPGPVINVGLVIAPRGNVTIGGRTVEQDGVVSATTSGKAGGSIIIGQDLQPVDRVTFGPASSTQILPDDSGEKLTGKTALDQPSAITVVGERIELLAGATIYAPSGFVKLSASMLGQPLGAPDDTRIYLEAGSRIDVSGLVEVPVSMDQNSVRAELRAGELRDNPVLRSGPLRGKTVYFDPRTTVSVADLTGYLNLLQHDVRELMTAGGSLTLAANEVVTRQGSVIDLSGGSLRYGDGYTRTSVLLDEAGRAVAIQDAVLGRRYIGLVGDFVEQHRRWGVSTAWGSSLARAGYRFEKGYQVGGAAGQLTITTNDPPDVLGDPSTWSGPRDNPSAVGAFRIFDGTLLASTTVGARQVSSPPSGAILTFSRAGDVVVSEGGPLLPASFGKDDPLAGAGGAVIDRHVLPAGWFDGKTISRVAISTGFWPYASAQNTAPGGHLSIPAGTVVDLGAKGQFTFSGKGAEVEGTIVAPGGSVSITTLQLGTVGWDALLPDQRPTLRLGPTGLIDVAGRWSNGWLDPAGTPVLPTNGGSVTLVGSNVVLEPGSLVDVSGGARLDSTRTRLSAGSGGTITIDTRSAYSPAPSSDQQGQPFPGRLLLGGELRGYGVGGSGLSATGKGGTLEIDTPWSLTIRDGATAPPFTTAFASGATSEVVPTAFFGASGFSSFTLLGEGGITLEAGAVLRPQVETRVLPVEMASLPTGTPLADQATRQVLTGLDGNGLATSLTLSTAPNRPPPPVPNASVDAAALLLAASSAIRASPGSSVALVGNVSVAGAIEVPGGNITVGGNVSRVATSATLLPSARLSVAGNQTIVQDGPFVRRAVASGGTITLSGYAVDLQEGALLDASGALGIASFLVPSGERSSAERYEERVVGGAAGTVAVSISTSGASRLAGTLLLAGGDGEAQGGTLSVDAQSLGASFLVGPADLRAGWLTMSAPAISGSGADNLTVRNYKNGSNQLDQLVFEGGAVLTTRRSIRLLAPVIGTRPDLPGDVTLRSASVQLGGASKFDLSQSGSTGLAGTLTVDAGQIDIVGSLALGTTLQGASIGGFSSARFLSAGDVRLADHDAGGQATGGTTGVFASAPGLFSDGAIAFNCSQLYVLSRLQPQLDLRRDPALPGLLVQSGASIAISGNGRQTAFPLSFGERLTIRAPVIEQAGVVRAPQGELRFEGKNPTDGTPGQVVLAGGSLTSTSLEDHQVPFGGIPAAGTFRGYDVPGQVPTKSVSVSGQSIELQKGAVVDVSGGGDLLGISFAPGNGGSRNILATPGTFAILPSVGAGPSSLGGAPELKSTGLRPGDAIYLQGVPGLADGLYTLLPATYAMLPGGRIVQPISGNAQGTMAEAPPTLTTPDGGVIASGYRGYLDRQGILVLDPGNPGWAQFKVMDQAAFGGYSELKAVPFGPYAQALAADAGKVVRVPADAGSLALAASTRLSLQGSGRFQPGQGGLLGSLDISAARIAVLDAGKPAPGPDWLALPVQDLQAFGAGSTLLGGARTSSASGVAVTTAATEVLVDTSTGWTAPEILLVGQSVHVADGSKLVASGSAEADPATLTLQGDGAMLRLSASQRVTTQRTGASGAAGDLLIGNASLTASGALTLEGSRDLALSPQAVLSASQLDLTSRRINLGEAPAGTSGTTLGTATVERLGAATDLLLHGLDSIHLYGAAVLGVRAAGGAATLGRLTLDTGALVGEGGAGETARITAGTLVLQASQAGGTYQGSAGALTLDVDALLLGPGAVALGYSSLQGRAGSIELRGQGRLDAAGAVTLATAQLRGGARASYVLAARGDLALGLDPAALPVTDPPPGGHVTLQGASVRLDAAVGLPGGTLEVDALGPAGTIQLGSHTSLDLTGRAVDFLDQVRFAPGGTIRLSAAGDLSIASGARLDVSGAARGGDAGTVDLASGGLTAVQGTLAGQAAPDFGGGAAWVDGETIDSLATLNTSLEAGGFTGARGYRVRSGDLAIPAGAMLRAHQVVLRADAGLVTVAGTIDASGDAVQPGGGTILLAGGAGLTLTGTLDAHAGAAAAGAPDPEAGRVELVAGGGTLQLAAGSSIDLAGGTSASGAGLPGGVLVLRALRDGAGIAVAPLAGQLTGARVVEVQGVERRTVTLVDAAVTSSALGAATAWLAAAGPIRTGLAGGSTQLAGILQVGAGLELVSAGDLTLSSDLALNGSLGAGYVGLVAGRDLLIGATLSDGFDAASRNGHLLTGRSSSYQLQAGRDVTLAPGALVRTGTGAIRAEAGRDLRLVDPLSSSATTGLLAPVLYTAGRALPTAGGFLGAPTGGAIGDFPVDGGAVTLRAVRDVVGAPTHQTSSAWLFRQGANAWGSTADGIVGTTNTATVLTQTAWSIVFRNFEQGVGALGGGDLTVRAGGDVRELQAAVPTTGHLVTAPGSVPSPADLVVRGGGDLRIDAGGDLLGGLFLVGRGTASLRAGGAAGSGATSAPLFALMDARASLLTGGDLEVAAAFDPARQGQIGENLLPGGRGAAWWGYTERTALEATSLGGELRYLNDPQGSVRVTGSLTGGDPRYTVIMPISASNGESLAGMFARAPGTLRLAALQGGIAVGNPVGSPGALTLAPAPRGQLELLAAQDVRFTLGSITMEEVAPSYQRGPLSPFAVTGSNTQPDTGAWSTGYETKTNNLRGLVPTHAGDPDPARIYALNGSVCGYQDGSCVPTRDGSVPLVTATLPKPLELFASRDILAGAWRLQNNLPSDLSWFRAGRDIFGLSLGARGVGAVVLEAGRDIRQFLDGASDIAIDRTRGGGLLGQGDGSRVSANTNPALPHGAGPDLVLLAGSSGGIDLQPFAQAYLDPAWVDPVTGKPAARSYVEELSAFMAGLGRAPGTAAQMLADFLTLPRARQEQFLLQQVYFPELKQAGIEYSDQASSRFQSYQRGDGAVARLFAATDGGAGGSVILDGKPLQTEALANISIAAPHGRVAVGSETFDTSRSLSTGIVTRRGGDISIMADANIDLFTSRVFTLQGGDVTMWTANGSITAGSGSKTAVFDVPLSYRMSPEGVVTINVFGLQTGSGIGVLDALQGSDAGRKRSQAVLVAPRGEVNAGDAGIRVTGDLIIAASVVVGVDNIQVTGGTSRGVPQVAAPNMVAISSADQVARSSVKEGVGPDAAAAQRTAADLPSIITVDVMGYETPAQDEAGEKSEQEKRKRKDAPSR